MSSFSLPTYYSEYSLKNKTLYYNVFLKPYLDAHILSSPSYRYLYVLWFILAAILFLYAVCHHLPFKHRPLYLGMRKFGIRRWSFRITFFNATYKLYTCTFIQAVLLFTFLILVILLSTVGPDYVNPSQCLWGGDCSASLNSSAFSSSSSSSLLDLSSSLLSSRQISSMGWTPSNDSQLITPNSTINKSLWTSANRFGEIAFALTPLVITLSARVWPIGILATPFIANFSFDKVAFFHKWVGRIIWLLSTIHVAVWFVQLVRDKDPFGDPVANTVWRYWLFSSGMGAYVILTILVAFTFNPLRSRYYEFFYSSHMLLSILFLVGCAMHFPKLGVWVYVALGLWAAGRLAQAAVYIWINGFPSLNILCYALPSFIRPSSTPSPSFLLSSSSTYLETSDSYYSSNKPSQKPSLRSFNPVYAEKQPSSESYELAPGTRPLSSQSTSSVSSLENNQNINLSANNTTNNNTYKSPLSPVFQPLQQQLQQGQVQRVRSPEQQYDSSGHYDSPYAKEVKDAFSPTSMAPLLSPSLLSPIKSPAVSSTAIASSLYAQSSTDFCQSHDQHHPTANNHNTTHPLLHDSILSRNLQPGQAYFDVLPGKTLRVVIQTLRPMFWSPGQHVLLTFPSLSIWQSHPYTICNASNVVNGGSRLVLLVRARQGLTKQLWNAVATRYREQQTQQLQLQIQQQQNNINDNNDNANNADSTNTTNITDEKIIMNANVSHAMGSTSRINWNDFSTLFIVCGGTGVSFGISILEHAVSQMALKAQGWGSRTRTSRVVLIWVLKDFSHLSWVSSHLRKCMDMSNPQRLRIELHVTGNNGSFRNSRAYQRNVNRWDRIRNSQYDCPEGLAEELGDQNLNVVGYPKQQQHGQNPSQVQNTTSTEVSNLAPPNPRFWGTKRQSSSSSTSSTIDSLMSADDSDNDTASFRQNDEGGGSLGRTESRTLISSMNSRFMVNATDNPLEEDFALFDGETDVRTRGEAELSKKIRREGKLRRAKTRRRQQSQQNQARNENDGNGNNSRNASSVDVRSSEDEKSPQKERRSRLFQSNNKNNKRQSRRFTWTGGDSPSGVLYEDEDSNRNSSASALFGTHHHHDTDEWSHHSANDDVEIELTSWQKADLDIVAELANTSRPSISKVLEEEKERGKGRILVACCGPTSLNTHVRRIVKDKIDAKAVSHNDERGDISLVCEDFAF